VGCLANQQSPVAPQLPPLHQHTESELWMTLSKWIPLKLLRFLSSCFLLKTYMKMKSLEFVFTGPPWRARLNQQPAAQQPLLATTQKQGQHRLIRLFLACQHGDCEEAHLPIASRWLHVSLTVSAINSASGKNGFLPYD
jgi:hypothetical protein